MTRNSSRHTSWIPQSSNSVPVIVNICKICIYIFKAHNCWLFVHCSIIRISTLYWQRICYRILNLLFFLFSWRYLLCYFTFSFFTRFSGIFTRIVSITSYLAMAYSRTHIDTHTRARARAWAHTYTILELFW